MRYIFDVTLTANEAYKTVEGLRTLFGAEVEWEARGVQGWPTITVNSLFAERVPAFESWLFCTGQDVEACKEEVR